MTARALRKLLKHAPGDAEVVLSSPLALKPIPIASGNEMCAKHCAWNGVQVDGMIVVLWVDPVHLAPQ